MKPLSSFKTFAASFAASLLALVLAHAGVPDLAQLKLQGRWPAGVNPTGFLQGNAVALSEKWALSATPFSSIGVVNEGAVHVFNAITGAWVRLLRPPAPAALNTRFGRSLVISGDFAMIGADGDGADRGAVHVYNLTTGVFQRTLRASDGSANNLFGCSMAVSGNQLIVGAYGDNSGFGSAYLFDWTTGVERFHFFPSDAAVSQKRFGYSVAIEGNNALISAPTRTAGRGAAYLFDLTTHAELSIIVPAASAAGDNVGYGLALSQGIAVMSAPYHAVDQGAVFTFDLRSSFERKITSGIVGEYMGYGVNGVAASQGLLLVGSSFSSGGVGNTRLYDLRTGTFIRRVLPYDLGSNGYFGCALAISGNTALIGSQSDDSPVTDIGSAYLIQSLTTGMTTTKVAARSDFAPSAPEAVFSEIGDAFINSDSEVAFGAKLSGYGSHANTDTGVWSTMRAGGTLSLSKMSYNGLGAGTVLTVGTPIINQEATALYPITYKVGVGGITALTNKAILAENGSSGSSLIQTGGTVAPFGTAKLMSFTELVQNNSSAKDSWAMTCTLLPEAATSTTALNDSGLYIRDMNGAQDGRREGQDVPPTNAVDYGQFTGRVAYEVDSIVFSAATTATVASNAVIMQKSFGMTEIEVARKGLPAPVLGGPVFSVFIGETVDSLKRVVYRATVTGAGITAANNEGLWARTGGASHELILRKGPNATLPVGLTIAKIIQFWGVYGPGSQVMALVQLGGVGINAANDQALILVQENAALTFLMREGQVAQGCDAATIGVITRVEVDPYGGSYAVLSTLVGSSVGTNLALFTGHTDVGNATTHVTLRRPELYLRKGALYDNQPSKIKSLSLPTTNSTASGASGTGRGRAISWDGDFVVTVEFENLVRQVMKSQL